jgi:hypothetical protein
MSNEDIIVVGFHLPNGGIGRVVQTDDHYSFVNI